MAYRKNYRKDQEIIMIAAVSRNNVIGIEGKIRWDSWTSKDTGDLNIKPIVIADNIRLLGSKKDNNSNATPQAAVTATVEPAF